MFLPREEIKLLWRAGACCFHPELHRHLFFSEHGLKEGFNLAELEPTHPGIARDLRQFVRDGGERDNLVLRYLGSEKHLSDVVSWLEPDLYYVFGKLERANKETKKKLFFSDLLMLSQLVKINGWQASGHSGLIYFENLTIPPDCEVTAGEEILTHWGVVLAQANQVPDIGWTSDKALQYLEENYSSTGSYQSWMTFSKAKIVIDFKNIGGFQIADLNEKRIYS